MMESGDMPDPNGPLQFAENLKTRLINAVCFIFSVVVWERVASQFLRVIHAAPSPRWWLYVLYFPI